MKRSTRPTPLTVVDGYRGPVHWRLLLQWLREDAVISAAEAARVHARCAQAESAQHALVRLAAVGITRAADGAAMDVEALTRYLAERAGLAYLRIDPLRVDVGKVSDTMSASYAERHKVLPVQVTPAEVVVATSEPFIDDWVAEVERQSRRQVRRVVANPLDIKRYTAEFFALARSVRVAQKQGGGSAGAASFEQLVELGRTGRQLDANDQGVIQVVDWLWQYAFDQRASDIHLEPRREQGVIRFRIDGVLHPVYQVPAGVMNAITARIKLLGRMDVVERRRPQDGRIKTRSPGGEEIEMRLSTLPTAFGEKLVMRIFDPQVLVRTLAELGFSDTDEGRWHTITRRPHGIVLVTGPTGSGKTTTLYSTLKQLATPEVNVCTIEDPIEMVEPSFNQMQVQHSIDLGFAEGVRALMRQDPDIIMVGEIRDLETAEMAIQAALTGHLVLSTLHTNDAPSAVTRMLDLGVPAYLLSATLLGIMAQRLVRILCPHCKTAAPLTPDEEAQWDHLVTPWKAARPSRLHHPAGCMECRMTGYLGRIGLYEILLLSPELRRIVVGSGDLAQVRLQAIREGMKPLRISGALKVAAGLTTLEEVLKVAPPAEDGHERMPEDGSGRP